MKRSLAGLTHVIEVRPCKKDPTKCCAAKRGSGPSNRGDFEKKCSDKNLEVPSLIQMRHNSPPAGAVQGLEESMSRKRRHALAEYGEPFGEVGVLGDLFDKRDALDFLKVAGSGLATAAIFPKLVNQLNRLTFLGKALPFAKAGVAIVSGFATYKYLGRKVPAKYRDAIVASAAVQAGLGRATLGHELLDKSATIKGLHGLGDLFPVSLANVGPSEDQLLAALSGVEDALSADQQADFGDVFSLDASVDAQDFDIPRPGFSADVDGEFSWAVEDQNADGGFITGGFGGSLDASIESQDSLDYGEYDLETLQMVGAAG